MHAEAQWDLDGRWFRRETGECVCEAGGDGAALFPSQQGRAKPDRKGPEGSHEALGVGLRTPATETQTPADVVNL